MVKHEKRTTTSYASEGVLPESRQREPSSRQRTATLPRVSAHRAGVTGHLPDIYMQAEGTDDSSKHESNPMPSDETMPAVNDPQVRAKLLEAAEAAKGKPNILIIEDTFELAEVIQATLEGAGMAAQFVSHGAKGLERIKQQTPDVLLLDIGLPDMTGWKMLEELRAWKKNDNDMPAVVVITAYGDPANRLIGKLQGINSYLIKPFTPDEVEKVVQKALSDVKKAGDGDKKSE